jgi:hypothetical protein
MIAPPARVTSTHVRVDARFAAYLKYRAQRERCTVMELTRRILRTIRQHQRGAWT